MGLLSKRQCENRAKEFRPRCARAGGPLPGSLAPAERKEKLEQGGGVRDSGDSRAGSVPLCAFLFLLGGILSFPTGASAAAPGHAAADVVLKNGQIYTVDAARSWAEAIAIRGDRIAFVGTKICLLAGTTD